ncbi:hypothetical protein ACFQ05_37385 [Amycolatopsis umgeniensis]|uniref:CD-NTase-associated protein 16 NUDIX domain-containing protein n=1 Tax=Amycolatopsis umgeniensis TaxID=336628 RepID=A0A841AQL8_9PSEU|nr:hypothetical protein [Amycolatopsis umgeniensis]
MAFRAVFGAKNRRHPIRVSFSALLRVTDDDRYVLFDSPARPSSYGPPGGVLKIHPPAVRILESWGFQPDRTVEGANRMKGDLRGILPADSLRAFQEWFDTAAYRESATECLRRELREEMSEVGLGSPGSSIGSLTFDPIRTVREGPSEVPGKPYLQLRNFEVYELAMRTPAAIRLRRDLVEAGHDEERPGVICAGFADIAHGRLGRALIAPQSAFLAGSTRLTADLPSLR